MWNTCAKTIPRRQIADAALQELDDVQTAILDEEAPRDYESALGEISRHYPQVEWTLQRFRHEMTRHDYSPAMRFEAVGQAIRLIRNNIGYRS